LLQRCSQLVGCTAGFTSFLPAGCTAGANGTSNTLALALAIAPAAVS